MNPTDVRKLYALAAALDDRLSLRDPTELALRLEAWNIVLTDLPATLDQAKTALAEHYRTSTDRIMPAHIAERVRRTRIGEPSTGTILSQGLPVHPDGTPVDPDDVHAYNAALRTGRTITAITALEQETDPL